MRNTLMTTMASGVGQSQGPNGFSSFSGKGESVSGRHANAVQIKAVTDVLALLYLKAISFLVFFFLGTKMRRPKRNLSVFQQTKILLWKNVLIKWRMKMQSFQVGLKKTREVAPGDGLISAFLYTSSSFSSVKNHFKSSVCTMAKSCSNTWCEA